MKKDIYSIPGAAKYCGLHRVTLWKYVKAGEIPTFKTPGGQYRIRGEDLRWFMHEKNMQPVIKNQLRKKILIVDDDQAIRKMLTRTFEGQDYELEYASDGFEAGLKIAMFKPHLILLDLFMPKINGFEVCQQIKTNEVTAGIKIIAISGIATEENQHRILACGADFFLSKPLNLKKLQQHVAAIFSR